MSRLRNERGGGGIKTIVILAVVLYIIYAVIVVVSTQTDDKAFMAQVDEIAKFAGVNRVDLATMKYQITKYVKENDIPLDTEKDLSVTEEGNAWHVKFNYDHSKKIVFYDWQNKVSYDKVTPKG